MAEQLQREGDSVLVKMHRHFNCFSSFSVQIALETLPTSLCVEIVGIYSALGVLGAKIFIWPCFSLVWFHLYKLLLFFPCNKT